MIACLPMYDWPELRWATDALWDAIAAGLVERGIDAPNALSRLDDYEKMWNDPELLLGMTCGKPYRDGLDQACHLVGNLDYGLANCPAGFYNSHIIARHDAPQSTLSDLVGGRFCFNGTNSESGYCCARRLFGDLDSFFSAMIPSGAHRLSAQMVADGEADFAAIDAATWRYMEESHAEMIASLKIIESTPPVPSLPLITRYADYVDDLANAVEAALSAVPTAVDALKIAGFVKINHDAYYAHK